ncbi:hypothetical protein Pmani_006210 [Petrolisthes manimaculis]|uniref:C2 domain-containing protein n=1 Tax=Petrolisthes manimaculis TaxID=1843537 RepID=A0AAE1QAS9_9EUCA|nr:hypothetical protein Pmani_006210 [Petrolisthes manimaculis]
MYEGDDDDDDDDEERGGVRDHGGRRVRQQRQRPRTIHIDVYCSSSSDSDTTPVLSPCEAPEEAGWRRPQAVVALGSKQRQKTEVSLGRTLPDRTSSFVYSHEPQPQPQSPPQPELQPHPQSQPQPAPRTTFITDDDLPLCSSPLPPDGVAAASNNHITSTVQSHQSPIPMPAPPQRPTSLAVPKTVIEPPVSENGKGRPHSSLSYLSSPTDCEPWGETELPESALSWRGSEFEASTPRLTSDMDLPSDISLASLGEDTQEAPRMWRSPQLERRRYIQKGQEDRYREALKRRTQKQQQEQRQQQKQQQEAQKSTSSGIPSVAHLPAFKGFSMEDLQVISKSLEQSSRKGESFTLPQQKESFRPMEKESNRLLEWMRQYKEQENQISTRVRDMRDSESVGYAESGKSLERTDSFGSLESKESLGTVERRKSFPGINIGHSTDSPTSMRRGESLTSLEIQEVLSQQEDSESSRRGSRPLEKRDSFRFQDKSQYYSTHQAAVRHSPRPLHRNGSGRDERSGSDRLESRDSPRLERKDSKKLVRSESWKRERHDSWKKEKVDSERVKRRDSDGVERSDSWRLGSDSGTVERSESWRLGRSESGKSERSSEGVKVGRAESLSSEGGERGQWSGSESRERRPSRALEQLLEREESSRSGSVEWQDVVSTVRRRLSSNAHPDPCPTSAPSQLQQAVASPLLHRRWQGQGNALRMESGRQVHVGVFRQLARFPFCQTVPGPTSRMLESRTTCIPEQRMFVRPQLFGQTVSYPRRRGIHFGPPRNPQCSCDNCRRWAEAAPTWPTPAPRLRAWSLSDLGSDNGEGAGGTLPHHPATSLSRTNSNVSDSATLSHAQQRLEESSHKLDLIRLSLERLRGDLPPGSLMAVQVKRELENSLSASPSPANYTSLYDKENYPTRRSQALHNKGAAVTGKLEVRLIGVQDLLEDVPGRSRRDSHSAPSDLKSFMKGVTKSSKSYSVKDEISNDVMAVLKLDNNKVVGQTSWKPCSQSAWDQRFSIDLEKSRDLEIDIYWRDWRSLCAVKFLRLEEFIDDVRHGMALQLEPKGLLFTEIKFLNPMISRKPKLQRQKKLFMQKGKVLRPNQMNINVAAWGRLIKNIQPTPHDPSHSGTSTPSAPTPITPGPRLRLDFDENEKTPGEERHCRPLAMPEVTKRPTSTPPPPPPRPHSGGTVTITVPASPVEPDVKASTSVLLMWVKWLDYSPLGCPVEGGGSGWQMVRA